MIKLGVSGCCGKMGQRIVALAARSKDFQLVAAIEQPAHPQLGKDIGQVLQLASLHVIICADPQIVKKADVLIEFSNPSASVGHLTYCVKYKKPAVIGTTGLKPQQVRELKRASKVIPIVFSPNMSVGVNLVFKLVEEAVQKLGSNYAVEILETHHIHKKDAPSGTAKRLAELIKKAADNKCGQIKINSIREGEIIGDHQVRFTSPQDEIIIKHSARSRDIFAQGALECAKFAVSAKPGLYDMQDVMVRKVVLKVRKV